MNEFEAIAKRAKEKAQNKSCEHCGEILSDNGKCTQKCELTQLLILKPSEVLKKIGVPRLYQNAQKQNWSKAEGKFKLFESSPRDIFLFGGCGSGKTHFAASLISEWGKHFAKSDCYDIAWVDSPRFLATIRASWDGKGESELQVIDRYASYGLLVIDDLGAEKISDWSISALYQLLSKRINDCKITIVTSNLDLGGIGEWNERISSRLSGFIQGNMGNKDRRVK